MATLSMKKKNIPKKQKFVTDTGYYLMFGNEAPKFTKQTTKYIKARVGNPQINGIIIIK